MLLGHRQKHIAMIARQESQLDGFQVYSLDVRQSKKLQDFLDQFHPDVIIHLATPSGPAVTEFCPEPAMAVHHIATDIISEFAEKVGAWMLFASSDFVFCGNSDRPLREEDVALPINVYGQSKRLGEQALLNRRAGAVLRLPILYGNETANGTGAWSRIMRDMRMNRPVVGVDDEYRSPLLFDEAARVIIALARLRYRGLIHAAGPEVMTPYMLLKRSRDEIGATCPIIPVRRKDYAPDLPRPKYLALDDSKLRRLLDGSMLPQNQTVFGRKVVSGI